ncbi:MAG: 3-hydroxyacyl-CoA dehydrogenase [Hyphomicrobiaceae bacterium]
MPFDPTMTDLTVGVVGAGTMGRGIIQVSAQGGMNVIAYDEKPDAAPAAKQFIKGMLERQVAKGSLTEADMKATLDRIRIVNTLDAMKGAHLIVEAIIERLDIKQALFTKLDAIAGPETIIASNTSSLPVTAIAAKCKRQERCAGLHFFNPVPLMRLVEVIPGLKTAPWVVDALVTIGKRMTREPVRCIDSPGFLVNHIGRALNPEAMRILSECIATHAEIDRILTGAPGFRMGPFTLMDLVGADVGHAVMESLYGQFYNEPAYAPSPLLALRIAGGLFGQKTGRGWYEYAEGKKLEPETRAVPAGAGLPVWVQPSAHHPELQAPLIEVLARSGAQVETGERPSASAVIIVTPLGHDVATAARDLGLDSARTVGVDVLFGMKGPRTLMVSPATAPAIRDSAHAMLAGDGQAVVVINDSPGFVAQRIVAQIVNVGCNIAQRGIASPDDIDKGAKLGLGYPFGPLEWGDRIGAGNVLHILECLLFFYGDPRYRPSPWLKRRAMLGLPLSTPEGRA